MQLKEKLVALAYTAGWMTASSGLILLNKYILSSLKLHYPLTLSRRAPDAAGHSARTARHEPPRGRWRHARHVLRACWAGSPLTICARA